MDLARRHTPVFTQWEVARRLRLLLDLTRCAESGFGFLFSMFSVVPPVEPKGEVYISAP